ncbi:MAG: amino acid adenylation domain-containing protein [Oscillatoria princeps RMCB-10]|jgi:amino acid adenylation domain-containing protein/non-ribosomal peptide synthase protein (TIGR01720 family)|nr:amino acid adenylation domain-containing protein [Oscillatoria princeps RMCB-10]
MTPETPASFHPLSLGQQALWFLYQMAPESVAYNAFNAALIHSTIDIKAWHRAWQNIVNRHPILRTTYTAIKGKTFQVIHQQLKLPLQEIDASHWNENELKEKIFLEAERLFNLEKEPAWRVTLFTRSEREHILLLTMHHIASDLWSSDLLFNELRLWYTAETEQVSLQQIEDSLPKNTPYPQFVHWQSEMLSGPKGEKLWEYWQKQLSGELPILNLPTDRPRPPVQSFRGETHIFRLNEELIRGLGEVARATGTTLYKLMLAAYFALLYRYTNQEDILVGTPMLGRPGREFKGVVGYFVNSVVLRASLSGNLTFQDLLAQLSSKVKEAQRHQDYPFPLLVEKLQPQRDPSRSPLFQVNFTWQKQRWCESGKELGFKMEPYPIGHQRGATFDLDVMVMEMGEVFQVGWEYNTDLFDGATISRMAGHFQNLLEGIVANPHQKLSELPLFTAAERHQLLVEWNNTNIVQIKSSFAALTASPSLKGRGGEKRKNYASSQLGFALKSQKCVHQLFEVQVELTPDAVAVVFEDKPLTYRQLNAKANQLAHHLQKLGVKPEVLVGICVERSLEMMVGLLGILKAGGAYVPLDPAFPKQRLAAMLEDSQVPVLVTSSHLVDGLLTRQTDAVCLDTDWETIALESEENPVSVVRPEHLVYVIYTSGSTGTPKGVAIEHRQLLNYLHSIQQILNVPNASFATVSTFAADLGNTVIFPALCGGGCLHIISQDRATDPKALAEYFRQHAIDCLKIVPSHLKALLAETASILPRKRLILGGEALSWELVEKVWECAPDSLIFNHYGPTETTVGVLTYQVKHGQVRRDSQTVPLGRPISNTEIYILDSHFQPVPVGTAGELYIGGAGLGRGYLNRPELTAEKFIANPFAGAPGEARLYKTGDKARYLPDGNIEFLGRIDNQVKIRGFRIELGEIESLLVQHPDVRSAVVIAREDTPGDKRLVAYVVPKQEPAPTWSDLRRFLFEQLPEYMVPATFVILEALPLTVNGKVDRRALPAPEFKPELQWSLVAPRTPIEEMLASIWADVLRIELVGVHHNFFELGGHSLLTIQVISRVRDILAVELPLRNFFEAPTIAEFAELIENSLKNGQSVETLPLLSIPRSKSIPLSFAQARLWFLDQLQPNSSLYNIPLALRLSGQLNIAALQSSINEIIQRHEAFRTNFTTGEEGQPVQIIASTLNLKLLVVDLLHLPESSREIEAQQLANEEGNRPFNLEQEPLLRGTVLQLGETEYVLLLTMHHIISDGWSLGIFIRELTELYKAFSVGKPPALPLLPVQYADFAVWQRQWFSGEILETQLHYWKEQLKNAPDLLELPTDRPRKAVFTFQGGYHYAALDKELSAKLTALSKRTGVTLFMTLFAAFQTLLYRLSGSDDIVVGTPVAGRNRREIEGLIGFFVNTLVLRTHLDGDPSFEELLRRVREVALQAYTHQDLPFEQLVEILQPTRDLSYTPLFQVMFALDNAGVPSLKLPELTGSLYPVKIGTAKFDLTLSMDNTADGLVGEWEYNADLFDETTIARMAGHFQTLLEAIAANPQQMISALPLLADRERHQLLIDWNNNQTEYPNDKCIHQLFEEQVTRSPSSVAVVFEGEHLTYRELNERANQLAHYLRSLGVRPEVLVGLCVERSLAMVIGILGILKVGGAYVPIDPAYPQERLAFMLEDSSVSVLLTQEKLVEKLPLNSARVVCLDRDIEKIAFHSKKNPSSTVAPDNLAYVIYTSGSTGKPKGVAVPHQAVNRLVLNTNYINLQPLDVVAFASNFSFDAATFEIWGALVNGAKLVIITQNVALSPNDFAAQIHDQGVTVLFLTTALFNLLTREVPSAIQSVRYLLFGGEAVEPKWVKEVLKKGSPQRVLHVYGPTENTTFTTWYLVQDVPEEATTIPIGRPIANTQVYLLDTQMQPVPVGVPGELYIGGDGLARGYLNRPDLTNEKFIPHPFSDKPGERLYKTGDKARYLPDGNIEFLGRIDNQVKIRGFRIELGEIETAIAQYPGVRGNAVIAREDFPGQKYLTAYIVPNHSEAIASKDLRDFLKEKLPNYMIPAAFVMLDSLPLTPNGKVDGKALPRPQTTRQEKALKVAPATKSEQTLAKIWREVLHLEQVGIYDNFFELGGDSILSILIISKANQAGLQLTPKQLFERQTIAELASVAMATETAKAEQGLVGGPLPLTPIQHWFFEKNLPALHHFNQAFLLEVPQELDPALLERAVQQLLVHHDALRLRYSQTSEGWQQVNALPDEAVPFSQVDLSALPETASILKMEAKASELQASLNLSNGPLVRVALFNLGSHKPSRLLLVIHHLAVDGVSWRILLEDMQTACQQLQTGKPIQLPPKTTSFRDWAIKLNEYARSDAARKELTYWQDISRKQITRLPVDYTVGANTVADARTVSVSLNVEETRALLQDVPRAYRTQINDVLLTALVQVLAAKSGSRSVLVDLEGHGREEILSDVDLSRTIGWFTTIFPVLLELEATDNLGETLKSIKEQLRAVPNRGIGYGLLRFLSEDAEVAEKLQALPTAEVSFNYLGQFDWGMLKDSLFKPAKESVGSAHSLQEHRSHLLDVNGLVAEGQLQLDWTYSANYHQRATIEELAREYIEALRSLIAHCQSPDAGGYTPSDFPLAKLDRPKLQRLLADEKDIEDIYPLSPQQQVMLSHTVRTPEDSAYFVQTSFTIHGKLNCSAFKQAWEQLVTMHQVFRTSFRWQELDKPLQVVHSTIELPWSHYDWQSLTASEQQQQLEVFLRKELELGFQPNQAPLMRLALVKLSSERYKFVWTCHHLLIDGWSAPILMQEVFAFYEALNQDETLHYTPPRPYRDYIGWLLEQDLSGAEAFWQQAILGFSPTPLGVRRALEHQDGQKPLYYHERLQLSATATAALRFVAQQHNLTLNTLVQGAWALLLSRYSGQSDVVFGSTVSGRPPALSGVESMVGMFINTLPVRVQVPEETELLPWLMLLQAQQIEREYYSYTPLMEIHWMGNIPQEIPLFESNLRFQNYPTREKLAQQNSENSLEFSDFDGVDFWHYPLNLVVEPDTELLLRITSDLRCFEPSTIIQILEDLKIILGDFVRELH